MNRLLAGTPFPAGNVSGEEGRYAQDVVLGKCLKSSPAVVARMLAKLGFWVRSFKR